MTLLHGSPICAAHDDPLLDILRLEKENFLQNHAQLTPSERGRLWNERAKQLTSVLNLDPALSDTVNIPSSGMQKHKIKTLDWQNSESQGSTPMSRKRPSQSGHEACAMKKSRSNGLSHPVQDREDCTAEPACRSDPQRDIDVHLVQSTVKVYSPAEYLSEHRVPAGNESKMLPSDSSHPIYPSLFSDSTPVSSLPLTTPISEEISCIFPKSGGMIRENSQFGSSLCDGVNLLGLGPNRSGESETPWDNRMQPLSIYAKTLLENPSFVNIKTRLDTTTVKLINSSQTITMGRSFSSESAVPLQPSAVRRHPEPANPTGRPIAPKIIEKQEELVADLNGSPARTIMVRSADGSMREARAIPKSSRERPTREGLKCTQCDEKPLGFHGQHELQRHIDNVHAVNRKAWVCIDISPDQDFLSGCRKCMGMKRYGASYNAAEHLRRSHFDKKPRARQSTGKGSDQAIRDDSKLRTSSNELKRWMREVTDYIPDNIPDSGAESRQPAKVRPPCNKINTWSYCKEDQIKEASESSRRPSSPSQSPPTDYPLANFDTSAECSQPISFITCDEQPIHTNVEHTAFHAPSTTSFPSSSLVDTFSNYEPFVFDPDFTVLPDEQIHGFPMNVPLQC